jgi:hypothetical protein
MAGDVPARVRPRHTGLAAQCRDENMVEVGLADYREAIKKKEINHLTGFRIWQFQTFGPDPSPRWLLFLRQSDQPAS